MATSTQLRSWWSSYRCNTSKMVRVPFPGDGRVWNLLVASEAAQAYRVFAEVMVTTGYLFRESAGGTYNCRKIAGTDSWSLHSYGIAVDLNPGKNPYGKPLRHNFPSEFIAGVDSIVTSTGTRAFKWGGRWTTPDAMHFEIDVSPSALAGGVTWTKPSEEDDMLKLIRQHWTRADIQRFKDHGLYVGDVDYWANDLGKWHHGEGPWDTFTSEVVAKGVSRGLVAPPPGPAPAPGLTEAQVKAIINQGRVEGRVVV